MNKIEKYISNLNSSNKNTRYEACEELRVTASLPESAIAALEAATNDPDPVVADAARRALAIHRPPPPIIKPPSSSSDQLLQKTTLDEQLIKSSHPNNVSADQQILLNDWFDKILDQQKQQTGYLRNISLIMTLIGILILLSLLSTVCSGSTGIGGFLP